jgi:5S rRNA maturation endonuclease (ribonuclease M5)
MPEKKEGWIDVQELMPRVSVQEIAAYFRFELGETFGGSGEQRTRCPVASCDGNGDYRSVSINVDDPKGRWKCHRSGYGCGAQGDKLTLAHCMKHGAMPSGNKLKGSAFREIATDLLAISGGVAPRAEVPPKAAPALLAEPTIDETPNTPLSASDNENARKLVTLDEHFVLDPSEMTPQASKYFRSREWMTADLCAAARCGYLPSSAKGLLRGHWVFGVLDKQGEPLCWVGRDLKFEEKYRAWNASGRQGDEPPKYRFPNKQFFRRKFELYGQEQVSREEHAEALNRLGLIVVEGFNDVLRLRQLSVPSVAIMSNRITKEQVARVVKLAEEFADGCINIMFDADLHGDEGAKEALWDLTQTGLDVKLVWSRSMFAKRFQDREPESLTGEEWLEIEETIRL